MRPRRVSRYNAGVNDLDIMAALASGRGPKPKERAADGPDDYSDMTWDRLETGVWIVKISPKPRGGAPEDDEQARLFAWLRDPEVGGRSHGLVAHSVPNDGVSSKERMVALKRTGLTKGVCDLYVMGPNGSLALEMKRVNGLVSDVSPEQMGHLASLAPFPGWTSCVCYGYRAARAAIERFLLGAQANPKG